MDTCFKTYRIKSRTRFIIFVAVAVIFAVVALNTMIGSYNVSSETIVNYIDIQVQSGDTLWSIAREYMPSDMDIRDAVYELCSVNDIQGKYIYDGQILHIPIYE